MLLSGDIGGTKASLALFEEDKLQCVEEKTFHSRDFSDFFFFTASFSNLIS